MRNMKLWSFCLSFCLLVLALGGADFAEGKKSNKACRGLGKFKKTKKMMGYYPSYNARLQKPGQIDYSLYTDLYFFVAEPQMDYTFGYGKDLTRQQAERLAVEFVSLAKKHGVNPLISYGGWTGSQNFSNLTSTPIRRKQFAKALVTYAKKFGFTGLDLDWEYPNGEGIGCNSRSPADTVNFGLLLREIRILWPDAQLTAALGLAGLIGRDGKPASAMETSLIARYLDFVNLMAYDVVGAWAPTTGALAPIHNTCAPAPIDQSVETGIEVLRKQGFKRKQIVLGLPAYAKRFQLTSPKLQSMSVKGQTTLLYQNHTKTMPPGGIADDKPQTDICGNHQDWGGSWLTRELISQGWLSKDQKTGGKGYKRHFDKCSGTPFLTDGKFFITYDDQATSVTKAKLAKQSRLAGVFFFDTTGPPKSTVLATRKAL